MKKRDAQEAFHKRMSKDESFRSRVCWRFIKKALEEVSAEAEREANGKLVEKHYFDGVDTVTTWFTWEDSK